jgi:hypothetical protein
MNKCLGSGPETALRAFCFIPFPLCALCVSVAKPGMEVTLDGGKAILYHLGEITARDREMAFKKDTA